MMHGIRHRRRLAAVVAAVFARLSAATALTGLLLAATPVQAECVEVSAREGWQDFAFLIPVDRISRITGGWTVDRANYTPVGAGGHVGDAGKKLEPFSAYKYDTAVPFGALLVSEGEGFPHYAVTGPARFEPGQVSNLRMRINDTGLGDNDGSLSVCLEAASRTAPASAPPAAAPADDTQVCSSGEGCISVRDRWNEESDTEFLTTFANGCDKRIYLRYCHEIEHEDGTDWTCYDHALSPGERQTQHTFFATGRWKWEAIGSSDTTSDSICRRKFQLR